MPFERYLLDSIPQDAVYVDVGASNGYYYALKVARSAAAPTVLAFEPDPGILGHLRRNIEKNGLTGRIVVLELALSAEEGMAGLSDNRGAMGHLSWGKAGVRRVRVGTLDQVATDRSLSRIDWIKVDIEGGEHGFLRGARRSVERYRPRMVLEVRDAFLRRAGSSADELLGDLASLGYWCAAITGTSDVLALPQERVSDLERTAEWLAAPPAR